MIVSGTLTRKTSKRTFAGILVCALAVLSLGIGCHEEETAIDSPPVNGQSLATEEPVQSPDREVMDADSDEEIEGYVSDGINSDDLPAIDDFVPVEQFAEMIHYVNPVYPAKELKAGVQGIVWVKVLVGRKGDVLDAVVYKTSGTKSLDKSALKAALENKFKPAIQDGKPVAMWVTYKVTFAI